MNSIPTHDPNPSQARRALCAALACLFGAPAARAQQPGAYPQRPIRFIVPNGPGSSVDTIGRVLTTELAARLHQAAVVDNRAGAGGALGVEVGRTSAPDGYSLILGSSSAISVAPLLQKAVTYEPLRDFELISLVALLPNVLVCHPKLPVHTPQELAAWCRSKGTASNMASAGIGSTSHLAGVAFQSAAGFASLHVPYKGGAQGVMSVVAGETDWEMTPAPAAMGLVSQGKLRLLGHSMSPASDPLGGIPAVGQSVPGYEFSGWIGLMGPKGLGGSVIDLLVRATADALQSRELRKSFETHGAVPMASTSPAFRAYLQRDIDVTRRAVQAAGLRPE